MNMRNLLLHTVLSIGAFAYRSEDLYDAYHSK